MKLLEKQNEKTTIILTTHSMEEAELLGDKFAIMKMVRLKWKQILMIDESFSDIEFINSPCDQINVVLVSMSNQILFHISIQVYYLQLFHHQLDKYYQEI